MENKVLITALVSAVGGGLVGGVVTYLTVKKTFAERAQRDIDDVKEFYKRQQEDGEAKSILEQNAPRVFQTINVAPGTVLDALDPESRAKVEELAARLNYGAPTTEPQSPLVQATVAKEIRKVGEEVVADIFNTPQDVDPGPSMVGLYTKVDGQPYIISHDEYFGTEEEFEKVSIVYFEGDDTLADERNQVIQDVEYAVGQRHLEMYGPRWEDVTRSEDPEIVYVRNTNLSTDFEIARDPAKYQVAILSMDPADLDDYVPRPRPQRMRDSD